MAENKTIWTGKSVAAFLDAVPDPKRRADGKALCALFERVLDEPPEMFGPTIVGFGRYHYRYASGREGDACATGFSPRGQELVVYVNDDSERTRALLKQAGQASGGQVLRLHQEARRRRPGGPRRAGRRVLPRCKGSLSRLLTLEQKRLPRLLLR